jgi:hypothetical protein
MLTVNVWGSLLGVVLALISTIMLKPTSGVAFIVFLTWTAAPFIGGMILTLKHKNQIGIGAGIYLSLLVNILFFCDIRYWHPDPQGPIALLCLPIISVGLIAVSVAMIKKKINNSPDQPGRL